MFLLIENMARSMHFISIRLCLLLEACVWSAVCKMLVYTTVMIVNVLFVFCTGRNAIMHFKWHTNGKFIGEDFTQLHQYRAREWERERRIDYHSPHVTKILFGIEFNNFSVRNWFTFCCYSCLFFSCSPSPLSYLSGYLTNPTLDFSWARCVCVSLTQQLSRSTQYSLFMYI